MAVIAARVTVGSSAPAALGGADTGGLAGSATAVRNLDSALTVYLGGANVTAATGYPLGPGSELGFDNESGDQLYAITASGSASVAVLRVGV